MSALRAGQVLHQFPGPPEPFSHSKNLTSVVPFHFYWRKLTVFCSLLEAVRKSLSDSKCCEELKHWEAQANSRSFCKVTPIRYNARWAFTGSNRKKGRCKQQDCFQFQHCLLAVFCLPWKGINHSKLTVPWNSASCGTVNKEIRQIISFYENI